MTVVAVPDYDRRVLVVLPLARQEGARLLRHPITLVGLGMLLLECALGLTTRTGPPQAYFAMVGLLPFFPGVFLVLSASLCASRDGRAGSEELLGSMPASRADRTLAQLVAAVWPTLVATAILLAMYAALTLRGEFVEAPTLWHLAQGPLNLLGASALGTMVGRWAASPPAALVVVVALVAAHLWLSETSYALLAPMFDWVEWGVNQYEWSGTREGSAAKHAAYLVGLVGLAACGALLRDVRRRGPLIAVAAGFLVLSAVAGVAQLP